MVEFPGLMTGVRWQDIIDIAMVSYVLFRLYALFRGTNVFRVLIGIAFLWFFQRFSVSLGLIVTSWALQGITAAAALIIIVVFRNEIRSVLQAKNLKAIFWGIPHKSAETPLELYVDGIYELARQGLGALIVFPGQEDLTEAVHSGIAWRGLVSKEMIVSIFWRDNPVHDGAAIVEGDRVVEVGAILPLSRRKDLPAYYGTRHRAALGLAEVTDALVLVVSEERGRVAAAKGGRIGNVKGKVELSLLLKDHLGLAEEKTRVAKKERVNLGAAALVSVLFITGVWLGFTRGQDTLITLDVPIEYTNRDPTMEILKTSANDVRVDLIGSGALIRSLRPEQLKVRLDLSGAVAGRNAFTITPERISLPPGVLLKNIQTAVVDVHLDVLVKKSLPIQVDWAGRLPDHLILSGATLDPERIEIIGGRELLKNLSTVFTEKVLIDPLEKSGTLTAKLVLIPASLKVASGSKDRVKIEYEIRPRAL